MTQAIRRRYYRWRRRVAELRILLSRYWAMLRNPIFVENAPVCRANGHSFRLKGLEFTDYGARLKFSVATSSKEEVFTGSKLTLGGHELTETYEPMYAAEGDTFSPVWRLEFVPLKEE